MCHFWISCPARIVWYGQNGSSTQPFNPPTWKPFFNSTEPKWMTWLRQVKWATALPLSQTSLLLLPCQHCSRRPRASCRHSGTPQWRSLDMMCVHYQLHVVVFSVAMDLCFRSSRGGFHCHSSYWESSSVQEWEQNTPVCVSFDFRSWASKMPLQVNCSHYGRGNGASWMLLWTSRLWPDAAGGLWGHSQACFCMD